MQPNARSKRLKISSSVPLQQQAVNFPYNYGTGSHHRSRIHSTLCKLHASTPTCWHMKPYMAIRLELVPPCPPRMQSHHIQIPQGTGIVGNTGHRRVVSRPIGRPLPMQSLLCPQNTSVPDIRLHQTLPTTLPGPLHVSQGSVTRSDKRNDINANQDAG
jgi:hypothetical protein